MGMPKFTRERRPWANGASRLGTVLAAWWIVLVVRIVRIVIARIVIVRIVIVVVRVVGMVPPVQNQVHMVEELVARGVEVAYGQRGPRRQHQPANGQPGQTRPPPNAGARRHTLARRLGRGLV